MKRHSTNMFLFPFYQQSASRYGNNQSLPRLHTNDHDGEVGRLCAKSTDRNQSDTDFSERRTFGSQQSVPGEG